LALRLILLLSFFQVFYYFLRQRQFLFLKPKRSHLPIFGGVRDHSDGLHVQSLVALLFVSQSCLSLGLLLAIGRHVALRPR